MGREMFYRDSTQYSYRRHHSPGQYNHGMPEGCASKRFDRQKPRRKTDKKSALSVLQASFGSQTKSLRKPTAHSRSFAPRSMVQYGNYEKHRGFDPDRYADDEDFFDMAIGSSEYSPLLVKPSKKSARSRNYEEFEYHERHAKEGPIKRKVAPTTHASRSTGVVRRDKAWNVSSRPKPKPGSRSAASRDKGEDETDLVPDWIENMYDNSDRKAYGIGILDKIFGSGDNTKKLEKLERDHRPFFTYWVTIVQLIIYIVAVATYGIAPIGLGTTEKTGDVLMTSLAVEQVSYEVVDNLFIGPSQADLIKMGAKYSPCMRKDQYIEKVLEYDAIKENGTACCVNNDGSGCVQTTQEQCSGLLSTWIKWSSPNNLGFQDRTQGSVCGQDPLYCTEPASTGAYKWADDLTQWPLCVTSSNVTAPEDYHMSCEVIGRPCCIGIQAECVMATREYCDFVKGYFHEEATLCSQVSCEEDICGQIPFADPSTPDQFYRLLTSPFLHAGLLDLVITLIFQLLFMRDLEKMIGTWRVTLIYLLCALTGSLASATFIPYFVEVGPSGAQFGILAALFVEIFRWESKDGASDMAKSGAKMAAAIVVMLLIGMILPQIDNYSHIFGFIVGLFLAVAFRPYKAMCGTSYSKGAQAGCIIVCLALAITIFVITVVLFYVITVAECDSCMFFNCIPFTSSYCRGMSVTLDRYTEYENAVEES